MLKREKKKYQWNRLQRRIAPYIFIAPPYLFFLIFGAFPVLFSFYLSFQRWNGISAMKFIGLGNYTYLLTDIEFWNSLKNTLVLLVMGVIPQHVLGLFFAFILNTGFVKFKNFFKATMFLPYITSSVAVALIFTVLYGYPFGILNYFLKFLAEFPAIKWLLDLISFEIPVKWLGQINWIKPSIALLIIWRWTGWNTILYLAGLQAVPEELYEAARVDGANWRQVFFRVTIPLLKPVMLFAFSMSIIYGMQAFDEPFIMLNENGGVGNAGMTTAMYMYRTAFSWNYFGSGASIAYGLFVVIMIMTWINSKILNVEEGGL